MNICQRVEKVNSSHNGCICTERVEWAHFPACRIIKVDVGENGCKPGGCEQAVFGFKPDKKRDEQDEKDGVHELPVAKQVKKLVSGFMAHAAADEDKQDVRDEVQVRKDC